MSSNHPTTACGFFLTSHPGAQPGGGIAGPVLLSVEFELLNQFKFMQTDILTGDETLWNAGCSHQWDPWRKSPALLAAAGLAMDRAYGKLLSPELGFLLVQGLSDLLVTE